MKKYLQTRHPQVWKFLKRLRHPTAPLPPGLWILNFIVQRLFCVNADVPWNVHFTSSVVLPQRISIGDEVEVSFAISGGCYIQGGNGITIGDRTIFAPGVKIISANHNPQDLHQWLPENPIVIGKDCWLGANAVILPGVQLGDRCVVGASAVVTKSFPAGSILVGIPARNISPKKEFTPANAKTR